jgi:hypothetical protein
MSNNLKFRIAAVDTLTKTLNNINASMSKLTRPLSQFRRDMANLKKAAGFDKIAASLKRVGTAASAVGAQIRSVAAPMLALVGGGTLAGLYALTTEWARLGLQISQTAQTLGLSTQQLQAWRGAAQALGISAETLDAGMKSLGDTIEDALYGRNAEALVMMNKLGLSIHRTKDGAIDTTRAMLDLSRGLSRIRSPQVQGLVARSFGVEGLLPLLRQGPKAIRAYQQRVAELGGVMSGPAIDAAERFGISLNYLRVAVGGLRNTIGQDLIPIVQPLVEQLTEWIAKNRELIASDISSAVRGLADWLKQVDFKKTLDGLTSFISGINSAVEAIGGWKTAAIAYGAIMTVNMLAPTLLLITALGKLAAAMAINYGGFAKGTAGLKTAFALGLGKVGLLGTAAYAGVEAGGLLYDKAIAGTSGGDLLGGIIAEILGKMGVKSANEAIDANTKGDASAGRVTFDHRHDHYHHGDGSVTTRTTTSVGSPGSGAVGYPQLGAFAP